MLIFQGVKGFRENHHHFYSGFFFRLQWWIAGFQVCRLKHLWIFSLWFGDKKYFLQKNTTWAEILNTKKCPHPLKLRWIPQKMMGRLENLSLSLSLYIYIFSPASNYGNKVDRFWVSISGGKFTCQDVSLAEIRRFVQVVEGQELRLGRSYRLCVDRSSEKMKRREVVKYQVVQSDLFGMVKTWPFGKVKWPPTRGSKGHFESPSSFFLKKSRNKTYFTIRSELSVCMKSWYFKVILEVFQITCHIPNYLHVYK